jgi:hypothetical protein
MNQEQQQAEKSWLDTQIGGGGTVYEQERLSMEATELLLAEMKRQRVSKSDLARRMNTTRANVTQLLGGGRSMTLRTLAHVAHTLGKRIEISFGHECQCSPCGACGAGTVGSVGEGV